MSDPQQPPAQPYGQPTQPGQPHGQPADQPVQHPGQPTQHSGQPPQPAQPYGQPNQAYGQPGQPYGQPAQPYGQPNQPYGQPGPRGGQGESGNSLGRTAFLISVIALGVGLLLILITPFLYSGGDFTLPGLVNGFVGIVLFLAHVAALILGIIVLRRSRSNLWAAIAVGISGSAAASHIFSWLAGVFYSFL